MSKLADATPEEVRLAMRRAKESFGPFRTLSGRKRSSLLCRNCRKIKGSKETLIQTAEGTRLWEKSAWEWNWSEPFQKSKGLPTSRERKNGGTGGLNPPILSANPCPSRTWLLKESPSVLWLSLAHVIFPSPYPLWERIRSSALAVGCPVIVKSHPEHAQTCQSIADLVKEAIEENNSRNIVSSWCMGRIISSPDLSSKTRMPPVLPSPVLSSAVKPCPNLLRSASSPIPFHAEMGSLNAVFALPRRNWCRRPKTRS